jgi:hypothetical protein
VSPAPVIAARCGGSASVRRSWYGRLARGLAGGPRDDGVLFERATDRVVPWAIVRSRSLLAATTGGPAAGSFPLETGPPPVAPRPPDGRTPRLGVLRPASGTGPRTSGAEGAILDGPGPDPPAWYATQTFWAPGPAGQLRVAVRFAVAGEQEAFERGAAALVAAWDRATGGSATVDAAPRRSLDAWSRGAGRGLPPEVWATLPPGPAVATAELLPLRHDRAPFAFGGHGLVFGSSGAGKTSFLAARAADGIERGVPTVVVDLHGDLGPALVDRLSGPGRARLVAIDVTAPPVPGVAVLPSGPAGERAAAHLVAALKRITADGAELHWGFRLERILDAFARLAVESGGTLVDIHALLTRPERRASARLATRSAELARFLEELEPIVRRTPDFLWPAATRLAKVVLVRELAALLAPVDGGVPVEALLAAGRSLVVRLPFAGVGPEAASFAGTLVLARVYLGLAAARSAPGRSGPTVRFVLDEVQALAPRLLAEMLAESRKFGAELLLATQYPERLAPELRAAAAGAARQVGTFRIPPASTAEVGRWLGIDPAVALRALPELPTGVAVTRDPEDGAIRVFGESVPPPPAVGGSGWSSAVDRTRGEFGTEVEVDRTTREEGTEELLFQVLAAEEEGERLGPDGTRPAGRTGPTPPATTVDRRDLVRLAERRGWLERTPSGLHLTAAGERQLGLHAATGAARETPEHRALLFAAFRILARRGCRLEIVPQGRFDAPLPDARLVLLPSPTASRSPGEVAAAVDRARAGWAWRFFGGRDVHVEAEVSGALRPERIRRGLAKARARDAFVLFLVSDATRARRVRAALEAAGADRTTAQVWTLRVRSVAGPSAAPRRDSS